MIRFTYILDYDLDIAFGPCAQTVTVKAAEDVHSDANIDGNRNSADAENESFLAEKPKGIATKFGEWVIAHLRKSLR